MTLYSNAGVNQFEFVLDWICLFTFLVMVALGIIGFRMAKKEQQVRRQYNRYVYNLHLTSAQMVDIIYDSLFFFGHLCILFYISDHIENIILCHVQIVAIIFRFCFSIGRSLTLSKRMFFAYLCLIVGVVIALFTFRAIKSNYTINGGLLSILGALLAGNFWLNNRDGKQDINLGFKMFLICVCNFVFSLVLILLFYDFVGLLGFLSDYFFHGVLFTVIMLFSFYLKSKVVELFDDLIFTMLYIFEPLCLFFYWEVFISMQQVIEQGKNPLAEFLRFLFFKITLIIICLILGQIWTIVEIKKSEMTLEGGNLGIRIDQRDQMKLEHLKMLKLMSVDN